MIIITSEILKSIAPGNKKPALLLELASWMTHWGPKFGVDTPAEWHHFLAQTAHESASFNTLVEYGKDSYFKQYDGRRDLGNTQEGDGLKFKGRGLIQTTGRANYYALGVKLGMAQKFIRNPELLEVPAWGVWAAFVFWDSRQLNDAAVLKDTAFINTKKHGPLPPIKYITYRVNGGFRGLPDRINFYNRAKKAIK